MLNCGAWRRCLLEGLPQLEGSVTKSKTASVGWEKAVSEALLDLPMVFEVGGVLDLGKCWFGKREWGARSCWDFRLFLVSMYPRPEYRCDDS